MTEVRSKRRFLQFIFIAILFIATERAGEESNGLRWKGNFFLFAPNLVHIAKKTTTHPPKIEKWNLLSFLIVTDSNELQ